MKKIKKEDRIILERAVNILEYPALTAQLSNLIGMPIEKAFEYLPEKWNGKLSEITQTSLQKALQASLLTMDRTYGGKPFNKTHKVISALSGAAGGAFGLMALSIELPFSTTVALRSIADIARSEGENIYDPEVQMACLEVFALGGKTDKDDSAESGYFAVRISLARSVTEASKYIAEKELSEEAGPILIKLIAKIAARFQIQITEKAAAQLVPLIGAGGGAIINFLFLTHFQNIAWAHFNVRKLENVYGKEIIKKEYEKIMKNQKKSKPN